MKDLFTIYLQAGLFGSVMIVMILLLRNYLKQAPRKYLCILWLLAVAWLLLPFQLESHLSLQPRYEGPVFSVREEGLIPTTDVLPQWTPDEPNVDTVPDHGPVDSAPEDPVGILSVAWMMVGSCLLVYAAGSYGCLRFKVRDAVKIDSSIMESDRIHGAFLLGYFKPRIYIPVGLSLRDRAFIIAHERSHISRGDNWWKLAGFLCCCVHWYNPLVWLGYGLLCRDIEIACDERVVRDMDLEQRKAYSLALLNCGKRLSGFLTCPVAFGEVSLKQRIKNVLSYRRPGLWITVIAVVLVVFVALCFLTTPVTAKQERAGETAATEPTVSHVYDDGIVTAEASCAEPGAITYTCTVCGVKKTEPIAKLSHAYDEGVESQAASCSETGVYSYTCQNCGDTIMEEVHTLDHTFGEKTVIREATCKSEGEISVTCAQCGFQLIVEKIPKTDEHNYQNRVIRRPTCVDRGEGEDVCIVCGHSVVCDYDLGDHAYGDGVVTKEASCTEKGEKTYTCSVCAAVYTKTIPTKDHTWNDGFCASPASCTVCGYTDSENRGHDYVLDYEEKAGQNFAGRKVYRCSRCDNVKTYYSGLTGAYDFEAVKAAGRKRAKELGIGVAPAGYEVHTGHKEVYQNYYFMVEQSGGQAALEQGAIQKVNRLYDYLVENGIDPSECYLVITVSYRADGSLGTGTFFITVTA